MLALLRPRCLPGAAVWAILSTIAPPQPVRAVQITLNTSGCKNAWTAVGEGGWFFNKLSHPPFCANDIRSGSPNAVGAMTALHAVPGGSEIVRVSFSYRYACGYCGSGLPQSADGADGPPVIHFEFVKDPKQPATAAGSVVATQVCDGCANFCYDHSQYSPVINVAAKTSIAADGPMYFRIRMDGGKQHNLQIPVYAEGGPDAVGAGGLTNIVIETGALPMSVGTILLIVFFAGVVAPYLLGGVMYRKFVLHENGWDAIPNRAFWAEVRENIGIGCAFTFRKARNATHTAMSSNYEAL